MGNKTKFKRYIIATCLLLILISLFVFLYLNKNRHGSSMEEIRSTAYVYVKQSYPEGEVKQIVTPEKAIVEELELKSGQMLFTPNEELLSTNRTAYKITFEVTNSMLGNIIVYMDKKTDKLLGFEVRE